MRARASAGLAIQQGQPRRALRAVRTGLRDLRHHFRRFGGGRAWRQSGEGRVLKRLSVLLSRHVPQTPGRRLQRKLRFAIRHEQYERAARLRDEIARRGLA
jgi:protein-arginine kinase activator protein McsA